MYVADVIRKEFRSNILNNDNLSAGSTPNFSHIVEPDLEVESDLEEIKL